jgi:hypothetical protein
VTREEHVALMALMESYHPGRIRLQDKAVVEMWYRELEDLPGEAVLAAVRHMARTSDQWPTLAQIRRWAAPVEDTAQLWADTVRLVCEYGPHGRWDSETRTTLQPQLTTEQRVGLDRIGGARAILEAPDQKQLDFMGKTFQRAVTELRDFAETQRLRFEAMRVLPQQDAQQGLLDASKVIIDVAEKMKA